MYESITLNCSSRVWKGPGNPAKETVGRVEQKETPKVSPDRPVEKQMPCGKLTWMAGNSTICRCISYWNFGGFPAIAMLGNTRG